MGKNKKTRPDLELAKAKILNDRVYDYDSLIRISGEQYTTLDQSNTTEAPTYKELQKMLNSEEVATATGNLSKLAALANEIAYSEDHGKLSKPAKGLLENLKKQALNSQFDTMNYRWINDESKGMSTRMFTFLNETMKSNDIRLETDQLYNLGSLMQAPFEELRKDLTAAGKEEPHIIKRFFGKIAAVITVISSVILGAVSGFGTISEGLNEKALEMRNAGMELWEKSQTSLDRLIGFSSLDQKTQDGLKVKSELEQKQAKKAKERIPEREQRLAKDLLKGLSGTSTQVDNSALPPKESSKKNGRG